MPAPLAVIWKPPSCEAALASAPAGAAQQQRDPARASAERQGDRGERQSPGASTSAVDRRARAAGCGRGPHACTRRRGAEPAAEVRGGEVVGELVRCAHGHDPSL